MPIVLAAVVDPPFTDGDAHGAQQLCPVAAVEPRYPPSHLPSQRDEPRDSQLWLMRRTLAHPTFAHNTDNKKLILPKHPVFLLRRSTPRTMLYPRFLRAENMFLRFGQFLVGKNLYISYRGV